MHPIPEDDLKALGASFAEWRNLRFPRGYAGAFVERWDRPSQRIELVLLDSGVAGCVSSLLKQRSSRMAFEQQYQNLPRHAEFPGATPAQGMLQSLAADLRLALPRLSEPAQSYFFHVAESLHRLQDCLNRASDPSGREAPYGRPVLADGQEPLLGTPATRIPFNRHRAAQQRFRLVFEQASLPHPPPPPSLGEGGPSLPQLMSLHPQLLREEFRLDENGWTGIDGDVSDQDPLSHARDLAEALEIAARHENIYSLCLNYLGRLLDRPVLLTATWLRHLNRVHVDLEEAAFLDQGGVWNEYSEQALERAQAILGNLRPCLPHAASSMVSDDPGTIRARYREG